MKKFVTAVLTTGLVLSLTACGGNVSPQVDEPDIDYEEYENDLDYDADADVDVEADVDYDESEAYTESIAASVTEDSVVSDFGEAQRMLMMVDGSLEADYSDVQTEEIDGYEWQYYRVTEPGISTIQDLRELLYTRISSSFADNVIDNSMTLKEFDGVLYMTPAGRGDDLTIASVEYSMMINDDGASGTLVAMIHRQDFSDETGEWYETGEIDEEYFDFDIVDGHAVFDTMRYF